MNNEIRAIIVEDVEAYLDTIEKLVKEVAPYVHIAGKASNLKEARKVIEELTPNLLFLDIQFEEEGSTAFDLLNQIGQSEGFLFQVIFITAHLEAGYYAEAFNYGALHFLEKPIDKKKLKEAIERAAYDRSGHLMTDWQEQLKHMEKQINTLQFPGKIVVEGTKYNEVIEIKDIILMEASGRYTSITLMNGKTVVACMNLGEFEKRLQEFACFCRIHYNKIINLNFVKRYSRKERIIELDAPFGSHIASKERIKDFIRQLETER